MNPTSNPNAVEAIAPPIAGTGTPEPASWTRLLLVALLIVLPGSLMANTALPLPVRGVSAIVCGLSVLLCGPHLFAHVLVRWARHSIVLNR